MKARALVLVLAATTAGAALGACKPSSVGEAEAKGDVAWLDDEGSPSAVEALGRLADTDPKAVAALEERAKGPGIQPYIAAWGGVKRSSKWASDLLHGGLRDPTRANDVASAVDGRDPLIAPFLPDVEASLVRVAAGGMTSSLAGVIAASGAPGHDVVVRRLADKTTRGAMCGGIASPSASVDARAMLRGVPATSRDDLACVGTVVMLAQADDATLHWLATVAEPGLLGAASRMTLLDCTRLHRLWADAVASREASAAAALTVPLSDAVKRCPATMDGVLADAIKSRPDAQLAVVGALDPYSPDIATLKATCAALPAVARGAAAPIVKERARDALAHGCKGGT